MLQILMSAILGLVVVEGFALILFHRATGKGIAPRDLIPNLAAGFFLLLTARASLPKNGETSWPDGVVLACLLAALLSHLLDLARRWPR